MNKKDSWLFFVMLILTTISVAALFYRSIILEDFMIMVDEETDTESSEETQE